LAPALRTAALEATGQQKNIRAILRDGIVVGVSNPKVIVFFVACCRNSLTARPQRLTGRTGAVKRRPG
jgi:threonine/homoserine/homoserine lactone efflux protein